VSGCSTTESESTSDEDDDPEAGEESLGPRQLRLLNRREYEATVADLFSSGGPPIGATCSTDAACDLASESCVGGSCLADPCEVVTFLLPAAPGTYGSVVVAGSFNGWAATEAAGGWPMKYEPSVGAWVAKRVLADGAWAYKLVADGSSWFADPSNPNTEPDGFGGINSALTVSCEGQPPPSEGGGPGPYTADFPVEIRPHHFPFDNDAASAVVTSVHVEQYLRAAARLADRATQDLPALLECSPASAEDPCVRAFVERFGRRVFRRPLTAEEAARYTALVAAQPDLATGVRVALRVMFSSPYFLYRFEIGEPQGNGTSRLTAHEIAAALSYAFWGTTPDDALLDAADSGGLDTPAGIEDHARRLLDDPRARTTVGTFAVQWLGVEKVLAADKNTALYPGFDQALRQASLAETRALVEGVVLDGGRFDDLFLADTTSAEGTLAELYGSDERGALPAERRAGLLTHASVLATYAHSDQTSPVRRGLFVRERLLCMDLGTPPANAGGVPDVSADATTRERFEQHSSDVACNSCHQHIDPLGFGFERFDAVGRIRDTDAGKPVDSSGFITYLEGWTVDGGNHAFASLPELGALLAGSDRARGCFVAQTWRFVGGRLDTPEDAATLARLSARFEEADGDVRELLVDLTQTRGFVVRR
jgi:hypothetical protein